MANATEVLADEIVGRLAEFAARRRRDKRKAFALKMGATGLGATVTVLLGLKASADVEAVLKNIALTVGALVTCLNAWDAFYDHRALWVKRTVTVAGLRKLERALRLACAAKPELDADQIERFQRRLDQILDEDVSGWVQLRSETPKKKSPSAASGSGRG